MNCKNFVSSKIKLADAGSQMATNKVTRVDLTKKGEAMVQDEEKDANVNTKEEEGVNVDTKELVLFGFNNLYVCVC